MSTPKTILAALLLFSWSVTFALMPVGQSGSNDGLSSSPAPAVKGDGSVKTQSLYSYIDINRSLTFINNMGSIGYNPNGLWSYSGGMFYPYEGDTMDIVNNPDRILMYSGGLFLGGKVGGETRVTVAAYDLEYVPGPMAGGHFLPDNSSFRVYKIDTTSGPGDLDYDNWPIAQGAPIDQHGDPLLLGQQTLWSVFNDADTAAHTASIAGTNPLGIEVRETVWGSTDPDEEFVFFVQYNLYNKGINFIDSFYIAFFVDPDIGDPADDLAGCDTALDMIFAFNGDASDPYYPTPPAWGAQFAYGPVVPSPGDTAYFAGNPMPNHRNLRMSSFSNYINGQDPDNAEETYLYMIGWDGASGEVYIDPYTGDTTTFENAGNPLTGTGWLDSIPADRRMIAGFGPLTFNPGDSQQVMLKIAACGGGADGDRLGSLLGVKRLLVAAGNSHLRPLYVYAYSPVNLWVIDPYEYYIGKDAYGTLSQTIIPADYDEDPPEYIDIVTIYYPFPGEYQVIVIPEDDAPPDGLYSVGIRLDGSMQCILVEDADVPADGTADTLIYIIEDDYHYLNGDANRDDGVNLLDILCLIDYLYGPAECQPYPIGAGDADCDLAVNLLDILYLIDYLYGTPHGPYPCELD